MTETESEQFLNAYHGTYSYPFKCSNCYKVDRHVIAKGVSVHEYITANLTPDYLCINCGCTGYIVDGNSE